MRSLLIVGALILAMIVAKFFFFKNEDSANPKSQSAGPANQAKTSSMSGKGGQMLVDVLLAKETLNNSEIYASGTLIANEEVDLRSETSGKITQLFIKEGSNVSKGQLIARLNDVELKARLKKIKYEEELANQIEARQKKLLDINAISKEEYDIAVNKTNTISADKEALLASLAQTVVKAPFSGKIGLKNISIGAYVSPSITIATLVQSNPIKLDFNIPEKYVSRIAKGLKVTINIEGINQVIEAVVIAIEPKIDESLRTIKVRASLPNPKGLFVPGMFAKVNVPLGSIKSIMVPSEAIIPFVGGKKIFLLKSGKAKEITISTGLRTDSQVEVLQGITKGDSIISSGIMNLKNEQKVKVRKVN